MDVGDRRAVDRRGHRPRAVGDEGIGDAKALEDAAGLLDGRNAAHATVSRARTGVSSLA